MATITDRAIDLMTDDLIKRLTAGDAEARAELREMVRNAISRVAIVAPQTRYYERDTINPWPTITGPTLKDPTTPHLGPSIMCSTGSGSRDLIATS